MSMKFTPSSSARRSTRPGALLVGRRAPDALAGDAHRAVAEAVDLEVADGDAPRAAADGVCASTSSRLANPDLRPSARRRTGATVDEEDMAGTDAERVEAPAGALVGPAQAGAEPSDAALVRAAQRGSEEAFARLFARHWPMAHRAAWLVVRDGAAAEDVAQEAFVSAARALQRFDRRRPFAPWLHRIVVNRAIDAARARRVRAVVGEPVEALLATEPAPEARRRAHVLRGRPRGAGRALAGAPRRRGAAPPARVHAGRDRAPARPPARHRELPPAPRARRAGARAARGGAPMSEQLLRRALREAEAPESGAARARALQAALGARAERPARAWTDGPAPARRARGALAAALLLAFTPPGEAVADWLSRAVHARPRPSRSRTAATCRAAGACSSPPAAAPGSCAPTAIAPRSGAGAASPGRRTGCSSPPGADARWRRSTRRATCAGRSVRRAACTRWPGRRRASMSSISPAHRLRVVSGQGLGDTPLRRAPRARLARARGRRARHAGRARVPAGRRRGRSPS